MKSSPTSRKPVRRAPSQERAMHTVNTLFEAAMKILEKEGDAALTTNKVARLAGFSIGTFYQYFPDRDALIRAMARRLQDHVVEQIDKQLLAFESRKDLAGIPVEILISEMVRVVTSSMATGQSRALLHLFWRLESYDQTLEGIQKVSQRLSLFFEQIHDPRLALPSATDLYVITRAMLGILRSVSLEKSSFLGSSALEKGLVKMITGILAPRPLNV